MSRRDCEMVTMLTNILWKKGVISDQDYEDLFYREYARDLSEDVYKKYAKELEICRERQLEHNLRRDKPLIGVKK